MHPCSLLLNLAVACVAHAQVCGRGGSEAASYFLDPTRICHDRYVSRLIDICRGQTPASCPLLGALMSSPHKLLPLLAMGCTVTGHSGADGGGEGGGGGGVSVSGTQDEDACGLVG